MLVVAIRATQMATAATAQAFRSVPFRSVPFRSETNKILLAMLAKILLAMRW
jgi:hypothetical protein